MSDGDKRDDLPEPPSFEDIDDRLKHAKSRIESARAKPEQRSKPGMELDPETSRQTGIGLAAAYAIIGLPFVGALIGWFADQAAGTPNIFVMVGVILGGALGIAHAVRLSNR